MEPTSADPGFWPRAKEIFGEVCELAPEARRARLAELKAGGDLRAAVEDLLRSLDTCDGFLSEPGTRVPEPAREPAPLSLERVGRYRLVRVIGSGGMGTVFEATQDEPRRTVAVKVLHAFKDSDRAVRRFKREAEILARLDHPNVARVLESGSHREGDREYLFLAMEYVEDSKTITEHAASRGLSERERVRLMLGVCDALHAAHTQGVIHRDLKPGNILVSERDGRARVIDFGVARIVESDLFAPTLDMQHAELVGSFGYMSPEQLTRSPEHVDTRSDVFALGVVLFQLLSGRMPFEPKSTSVVEISRSIASERPRPLGHACSADLGAIVERALERSPADRYQSVFALAEDLRRFLDGRIVEASRRRKWYVFRKTVRRHLPLVAAGVGLAAVLGGTATAFGLLYLESERTAERLRSESYALSINAAEQELEASRTLAARRLLASCPEELRGWEWHYLSTLADESRVSTPADIRVAAAVAPSGDVVAVGTDRGAIELWRLAPLEMFRSIPIPITLVESLSFSPDGALLAAGTRAGQPSFLLDVRTGETVLELGPELGVKTVEFMPDGRTLLTGSAVGTIDIRTVPDGGLVRTLSDGGSWVTEIRAAPDGRTIAFGRNNGAIEIWDSAAGEQIASMPDAHDSRVSGLRFSAGGERLHSAAWDGVLKTWTGSGALIDARQIATDPLRGLAVDEGRGVLVVGSPSFIEVRDLETRLLRDRLTGQTRGLGVELIPGASGGAELLSWATDSLRVWSLDGSPAGDVLGTLPVPGMAIAVSGDGRTLAVGTERGAIELRDAGTGAVLQELTPEPDRVYGLAFSPNGERLAAACEDGGLRVWSVADGEALSVSQRESRVVAAGWLDDDTVLGAWEAGTMAAVSAADGEEVWSVEASQGGLMAMAVASGRGRIATGYWGGGVSVWNVTGGSPSRAWTTTAHERPVSALAWSDDDTTLASGANDGLIRLWDPDDSARLQELSGHRGLVKSIDFSPDGSRVVSGAWEGPIRVWSTDSGTCLVRLRGHSGVVMGVGFTPDGASIYSTGIDGTVRRWVGASVSDGAGQ